ncbi:NUDIX domain-containing protein [Phycicoccus sp. BSK3Z-2]|uniref:NUDIX domain-containing protein n=1 Tax=Phycicoccus avicenniae TaxID=2828860 RepID=A0A941D9T3_9MICO|nr:NUDIX domain-containing protein [Phycicoccus avicenniae]MBR7744131.1 NUDIX domain-containing protein [Phycicoccus avicenniae]
MSAQPLPGQPGFVRPDPRDRPRIARRAVRLLVRDPRGRVLLFLDSDHGLEPSVHFWDTPGGGVDPGETDREAAVRELAEETGVVLSPDAVRGPVLERLVVHGYSDKVVDQTEVWFVVDTPAFQVDPSGYTEEERLCIVDTRWWDPADLDTATEAVWPADVPALLALAADADRWRDGPVPGSSVEESTVPDGAQA